MKAKRLTALALAALMTASGTSVAFAKEYANSDYDLDFVSSSGDYYYGYDEDENAIIKKKPSEFQPGDTIYIPLLEDSDEKFNNSRGKNFTVYIDGNKFDIGDKYVDDVGVVYKKGIYTVPGATTTTYEIQNMPDELKALNGTKLSTNTLENLKKIVEESVEYQSMVDQVLRSDYTNIAYSPDGGTTWYKSQDEAAEKAVDLKIENGTLTSNKYYLVDEKLHKDTLPDNIKQVAETDYVVNEQTISSDLGKSLTGFGWVKYDDTYSNTKKLYYDASTAGGNLSTGKVTTDTSGNALIPLPTDGTIYVDAGSDKNAARFINVNTIGDQIHEAETRIKRVTGTEYYDTNTGSIVTVKESQGYFEEDKLVGTDKKTVGSSYITSDTVYYDASNNPTTDPNTAKAAAKEKYDNQLALSVANNIKPVTTQGTPTTVRDWGYWAYIDTKKSTTTKDIDIVGKIYVGTSKSDAEDETGFYVDVTLTNKDVGNSTFVDVDSDAYIEPGQRAVLSFADDADDVVIEFGDDAWYEFNARGQGRVNFAYNTNFDRDFAYDYDHANIDFINFVAEPTTNKTGTLYIYADEDSYIYEVTSKGAKKINGAYYDDDEGAWVIRTRHLTSYAISDRRLKTIDQMEDDKNSSSSSKPSGSQGSGSGNGNYKPIPDTGR